MKPKILMTAPGKTDFAAMMQLLREGRTVDLD